LRGLKTDTLIAELAEAYVQDVRSQTRGSHRVKSANKYGQLLVKSLNLLRRTVMEDALSGYIERAQLRTRIGNKHARVTTEPEKALLPLLLFERFAFENLLKLDHLEALEALSRVRRCARCSCWFWSRVGAQRYCSGKCRALHYQSSAPGKSYKREWARQAYQRNKAFDELARKWAKMPPSDIRIKRKSK